MTFFSHALQDGYDLVLWDADVAEAMHLLIARNHDRLRAWEHWAQELPAARDDAYMRQNLTGFIEGAIVPCVIRHEGVPVGSISLRMNAWTGNGELGWWIDGRHEGRGVVRRAAEALIEHGFSARGLARIEVRTGIANDRSRALAERLGFALEGILRSAQPVGPVRHDVAVYGLLAPAAS